MSQLVYYYSLFINHNLYLITHKYNTYNDIDDPIHLAIAKDTTSIQQLDIGYNHGYRQLL